METNKRNLQWYIKIKRWLRTLFLTKTATDHSTNKSLQHTERRVCRKCGSPNVRTKAWIYPNKNNKLISYIDTEAYMNNFCEDCLEYNILIEEDKLKDALSSFWKRLTINEKKYLSGYNEYGFPSENAMTEEEYVSSCERYWEKLPMKEKIRCMNGSIPQELKIKIHHEPDRSNTVYQMTLERIKSLYDNGLKMDEILASTTAGELTLEQAHMAFVHLMEWAYGNFISIKFKRYE